MKMRLGALLAAGIVLSAQAAAADLREWTFNQGPTPKADLSALDQATRIRLSGLNRFALVIGNGSGYAIDAIPKADQDAASMAAMLQGLGFKVYGKINATKEEIEQMVREFTAMVATRPGATALFFYSGHGVQANNQQFLVPIDMAMELDEIEVPYKAVNLQYVINSLRRVDGARIAIIDACRGGPFVMGATMGGEIARVGAVPGSLVAFSTSPGAAAWVGSKDTPHTVYTEALLKEMAHPFRNIDSILQRTNRTVKMTTNGKQDPEYTYRLQEEYPLAPRVCTPDNESRAWEIATRTASVETLNGFIATCPDAERLADARRALTAAQKNAELQRQLEELKAQKQAGMAAVPSASAVLPVPVSSSSSVPVAPAQSGQAAWTPGTVFRDCPDCPEMVVIPAGRFMMGSPPDEPQRLSAEGPQHQVTFAKPFAAGKYPVTFAEWDACVDDGGCNHYKPSDQGWGRGRRPVINVSWDDAHSYIDWLNKKLGANIYRLLSEAEREYVTRAGTTTPFWFGDTISTDQANYDGNYPYNGGVKGVYRRQTVEVGTLGRANPFGLWDVHGNVWEWVEDCWHDDYNGAPPDGSAWTAKRCYSHILRGGSWYSLARYSRAAIRNYYSPDDRGSIFGFRLARTLP